MEYTAKENFINMPVKLNESSGKDHPKSIKSSPSCELPYLSHFNVMNHARGNWEMMGALSVCDGQMVNKLYEQCEQMQGGQ